jgi:hypothetical protein
MYKAALATLFKEVFDGIPPGESGTWFVQGKEGIFDAVRSLTPEQASMKVEGQPSSIGAHAHHLTYYLSLFNADLREEKVDGDWPGSWKKQEFDEASWAEEARTMQSEFEFAKAWYESGQDFRDQERATYAAANLAHAAYHLGAIRALMPIIILQS